MVTIKRSYFLTICLSYIYLLHALITITCTNYTYYLKLIYSLIYTYMLTSIFQLMICREKKKLLVYKFSNSKNKYLCRNMIYRKKLRNSETSQKIKLCTTFVQHLKHVTYRNELCHSLCSCFFHILIETLYFSDTFRKLSGFIGCFFFR